MQPMKLAAIFAIYFFKIFVFLYVVYQVMNISDLIEGRVSLIDRILILSLSIVANYGDRCVNP